MSDAHLEIPANVQIRPHISIYVVVTIAGASGSGMYLEMLALIADLTRRMSVDISTIAVMPNAFDSELDGRPEEELRSQASAYAAAQEIQAFRGGFGVDHGIKCGPNERFQSILEPGFSHQFFVVGRHMADGRDLRTLDAVIDSVALGLAGEIGTEIKNPLERIVNNQATLRGLSPDPITGQTRDLSTMNATSLVWSLDRGSRLCATRQLHEFLQNSVLGASPDENQIQTNTDAWLAKPLDEEKLSLHSEDLVSALRRSVLPDPSTLARSLFQVFRGKNRSHFGNGKFVQQIEELKERFSETQLNEFESSMAEFATSASEDCVRSLKRWLAKCATKQGWRTVRKASEDLKAYFNDQAASLKLASEQDRVNAKNSFEQAREAIVPMLKFPGSFCTSKKLQNRIANHMQRAMSASVNGIARTNAHRVF
ncbi:MAG: tubulin-like doman-containing protein, partial [Planctomycetota bacterium]